MGCPLGGYGIDNIVKVPLLDVASSLSLGVGYLYFFFFMSSSNLVYGSSAVSCNFFVRFCERR